MEEDKQHCSEDILRFTAGTSGYVSHEGTEAGWGMIVMLTHCTEQHGQLHWELLSGSSCPFPAQRRANVSK